MAVAVAVAVAVVVCRRGLQGPAPAGTQFSNSSIASHFFENGTKSGFEMCFGPSTLGAGAKTRLESRIKKFTPHCICRYGDFTLNYNFQASVKSQIRTEHHAVKVFQMAPTVVI